MKQNKKHEATMYAGMPLLPMILTTFFVLGILFTIQMIILGQFVNYTEIPIGYMVIIVIYWLIVAAIFTSVTLFQINRRYQKPMEQFAEATRKVANGDFSVYVPSRNRADRVDYLDAIFQDFNKMVEELGSIETLKTEFFSNVSHEIKTPLAVIQNYAEMLRNDNLTPEQQANYTDTILGASRRLSDLITNILKLNKLENQNIHPISESYNLCRQLCDCTLLYENQWEKKNIELIVDIEDCATINADASLLEIVWSNLLSNAVKFTPVGGMITLSQISTSDEIIVSLTDTGCGMREETSQRIFDKFYQGDTSHSAEGNGLGLAIVIRIVELVDGSITVHSELGMGSTFTVRLPVERKPR